MKNRNIFCARKGGATVNGKFFPMRTSDILAKQLERSTDKMMTRQVKRMKKNERRRSEVFSW